MRIGATSHIPFTVRHAEDVLVAITTKPSRSPQCLSFEHPFLQVTHQYRHHGSGRNRVHQPPWHTQSPDRLAVPHSDLMLCHQSPISNPASLIDLIGMGAHGCQTSLRRAVRRQYSFVLGPRDALPLPVRRYAVATPTAEHKDHHSPAARDADLAPQYGRHPEQRSRQRR